MGASVITVIDGATIEVEIEGMRHRVRYRGITDMGWAKPDEALRAKQANQWMVGDGKVLLGGILETNEAGDLSAYVWRGDELFVNASLISAGFVRVPIDTADHEYSHQFEELQDQAWRNGWGLWLHSTMETSNDTVKN